MGFGVGLFMIAFLASSAVFGCAVVFGTELVFYPLSILLFVSLDLLTENLKHVYEVHT